MVNIDYRILCCEARCSLFDDWRGYPFPVGGSALGRGGGGTGTNGGSGHGLVEWEYCDGW